MDSDNLAYRNMNCVTPSPRQFGAAAPSTITLRGKQHGFINQCNSEPKQTSWFSL